MKKLMSLVMTAMIIMSIPLLVMGTTQKSTTPTSIDKKKIVIGASLLTQVHPFYAILKNAMEKEAKDENVDLIVSIANLDIDNQISDIEDFINKKVDVIILSPVESKSVTAIIQKAKYAKIPVVTVDIKAVGAVVDAHVATDNLTGGKMAGETMAEALKGKGKVAIIDIPSIQSVIDRVTGFKLAVAKYPDIKIVATKSGLSRIEALVAAESILQDNPDINGIFAYGDDATLAAVEAVKSAGKENQVKVIGYDGMSEVRAAIKSEKSLYAVIAQYPEEMGKIAVQTAVKLVSGENVDKEVLIKPGIIDKKGETK